MRGSPTRRCRPWIRSARTRRRCLLARYALYGVYGVSHRDAAQVLRVQGAGGLLGGKTKRLYFEGNRIAKKALKWSELTDGDKRLYKGRKDELSDKETGLHFELEPSSGWVTEHSKVGKMMLELISTTGEIGIESIMDMLDEDKSGAIDYDEFLIEFNKSEAKTAKAQVSKAAASEVQPAAPEVPASQTRWRRAGGGFHFISAPTRWTMELKKAGQRMGRSLGPGSGGARGTLIGGGGYSMCAKQAAGAYIPPGYDPTPPKMKRRSAPALRSTHKQWSQMSAGEKQRFKERQRARRKAEGDFTEGKSWFQGRWRWKAGVRHLRIQKQKQKPGLQVRPSQF